MVTGAIFKMGFARRRARKPGARTVTSDEAVAIASDFAALLEATPVPRSLLREESQTKRRRPMDDSARPKKKAATPPKKYATAAKPTPPPTTKRAATPPTKTTPPAKKAATPPTKAATPPPTKAPPERIVVPPKKTTDSAVKKKKTSFAPPTSAPKASLSDETQRTRSGRRSFRVLDWWKSERIVYNADGSADGVVKKNAEDDNTPSRKTRTSANAAR